jgi:hypothetical protein
MRRKVNIQRHLDREREYNKKFGQLAKYEMRDNNLNWEDAKRLTRQNIIFALIKYEIQNGNI